MATRDGIYGIDLGTTNSAIALMLGEHVKIVRNSQNDEVTPSVVWLHAQSSGTIDEKVGRPARQQLASSPQGVVSRAKDFMGVPTNVFPIPDCDTPQTAVRISAIILRELAKSTRRTGGLPDPRGAVITIPAIFNQAARDDTRSAGQEAGFDFVELYPEPAAAALAFGHGSDTSRGATWLTYDLGGGTFDCALVRAEDGVFTVLDTHGDRRLGGGDLDVAIVRKLILPSLREPLRSRIAADAVAERHKRSAAWWQLLFHAEEKKIELDVDDETRIDQSIGGVEVWCTLRRKDVEALQTEIFRRTIELCSELIARNGFQAAHIERVLMVGGPTRSAFLRAMVESGVKRDDGRRIDGLGIALDHSVDPMTAVAQGAALYAATRRLPESTAPPIRDAVGTRLGVTFLGGNTVLPDDVDLLVPGRITALGESLDFAGWTVVVERLDDDVVGWHSEALPLTPAGDFTRRVPLQVGRNLLQVQVFDAARKLMEIEGGRFEIYRGIQIAEPLMEKGLGVADVHGDTIWFFAKGEPLPAGPKTLRFFTEVALARDSNEAVVIPIVEGTQQKAYLNSKVLEYRVTYHDVKQDVARNSPLDLTISVSNDRNLTIAIEFVGPKTKVPSKKSALAPAGDELRRKVAQAKGNHALFVQVRGYSKTIDAVVSRVDDEVLLTEIENLLSEGSPAYTVPWDKAEALLQELMILQQTHSAEVDDLLVWDTKQAKLRDNVQLARKIVDAEPCPAAWKSEFDELCQRFDVALNRNQRDEAESISYTLIPEHFEKLPALKERVSGTGEALDRDARQTSKQQTTGSISRG